MTAINAGSLAYDRKGNLTSNSNGQGYTWDFENLMKTATVGADTANYEYDAFRRRVKKSFQGASTVFVYDGWRCVAEYENGASASSPARDFVFSSYIDEPLMMVSAPAGAGTKRYYHSDHLYSVYALTDAGGAVVERYQYEAYGQATVLTAGFAAKTDPNYSEFGSGWTFTGQRMDRETGLHYYKNRYYSAVLGRFVSRDPVGYDAGSMGLYEYVECSPVNYTDPSGLLLLKGKGTIGHLRVERDRKHVVDLLDYTFTLDAKCKKSTKANACSPAVTSVELTSGTIRNVAIEGGSLKIGGSYAGISFGGSIDTKSQASIDNNKDGDFYPCPSSLGGESAPGECMDYEFDVIWVREFKLKASLGAGVKAMGMGVSVSSPALSGTFLEFEDYYGHDHWVVTVCCCDASCAKNPCVPQMTSRKTTYTWDTDNKKTISWDPEAAKRRFEGHDDDPLSGRMFSK